MGWDFCKYWDFFGDWGFSFPGILDFRKSRDFYLGDWEFFIKFVDFYPGDQIFQNLGFFIPEIFLPGDLRFSKNWVLFKPGIGYFLLNLGIFIAGIRVFQNLGIFIPGIRDLQNLGIFISEIFLPGDWEFFKIWGFLGMGIFGVGEILLV